MLVFGPSFFFLLESRSLHYFPHFLIPCIPFSYLPPKLFFSPIFNTVLEVDVFFLHFLIRKDGKSRNRIRSILLDLSFRGHLLYHIIFQGPFASIIRKAISEDLVSSSIVVGVKENWKIDHRNTSVLHDMLSTSKAFLCVRLPLGVY